MTKENDKYANTFRILFATDIHLGFSERDPIRGIDSLVTFEEILEHAQKNNVDFVLLAGNLFDENKPSRRMMHECLSLLRKYCMGNRPVQFEFLSDESVNFGHCRFPTLNYEDANLNISIPVFSIHGNHDDPSGPGNLCSLDIIHSAGLINYFGKTTSLEEIRLSPLLMQKGSTKLALYGLGALRDERLHRLFLNKNVVMVRPQEKQDEWFNMLVLHQNRSKNTSTNYNPEQFLDDFLNLVLWGHEHECQIVPKKNSEQNFWLTQPGSSIATTWSEGEKVQKHVGLLEIQGKDFEVTPIPLQTVRKFYFENIVLADPKDLNVGEEVETFCQGMVERLLKNAERDHTGNPKQPKEPLIRLKIDYTDFNTFNTYRFGRQFMKRVANPEQMIDFRHRRNFGDEEALQQPASVHLQSLDHACVEDMVKEEFSKADTNNQLRVLTEKSMSEAVREFVLKEEKEAISELFKYQLQKTQKYFLTRNTDKEAIDAEVSRYKDERLKNQEDVEEFQKALDAEVSRYKDERLKNQEDVEEFQEALKRAQSLREANPGEDSTMDLDSDQELSASSSAPARGQGRGRGKPRGRAKTQSM